MSFITYLDQEQNKLELTLDEKISQCRAMLYDCGCCVEKRPNGYFSKATPGGSKRKARFMVNSTKTNFCYEIVDCNNEDAVIMRENLMSVTNNEIINDIMGYIT